MLTQEMVFLVSVITFVPQKLKPNPATVLTTIARQPITIAYWEYA